MALDHAHGIGAEAVGQRQRVATGAEIDIDEIDGDVQCRPRAWPGRVADLDGLELQDFRLTRFMKANGVWHQILAAAM